MDDSVGQSEIKASGGLLGGFEGQSEVFVVGLEQCRQIKVYIQDCIMKMSNTRYKGYGLITRSTLLIITARREGKQLPINQFYYS